MSQGDPFDANYFEAPKADLASGFDPLAAEAGPPEIRTAAVGQGWGLVKARWGTWVLIMFLMVLCTYAVLFGAMFAMGMMPTGAQRPGEPVDQPAWTLVVIQLLNLITGSFFTAGLFRTAIKQVRGGRISVGDLFSAGDRILPVLLALLLYALASVVGFALLIIPGLYVMGRLMFMVPLAVEGGVGPWAAMTRSWDATRGQGWAAFWFLGVAGLAASLGALACGFGILLTLPIYYVATAILYRNFFRPDVAVA